jgi:hypothetical protein
MAAEDPQTQCRLAAPRRPDSGPGLVGLGGEEELLRCLVAAELAAGRLA